MFTTSPCSESVEMDQEDRVRYERALKKKELKDFKKTHEAILNELVPGETGREAYHRREESPDVELNDRDLMGDDDFQSRFAAHKRARDAREKQKIL
ncbi:unnamed protein product [Rhizophagus irregularis]|nr:unnamed protein product [Rhizophagus irregularis]